MIFLNPYDLADAIGFEKLNLDNLKIFKKQFLTELDLLDDEIKINDTVFSKSNCLEVFSVIDSNKKTLEYFYLIYVNNSHNKINDFLYGMTNSSHVKKINTEMDLESRDFLIFISPYLAHMFTTVYKNAFLKNDSEIIKIELPLDGVYLEKIYAPVYKILQDKKENITSLKKNNNLNINLVLSSVGDKDTINNLPNYFNKVKSDLFFSLRDLSIFANNKLNDLELAIEIINYVLRFSLEEKDKNKFLQDRESLLNIKETQKYDKISEALENHNTSLENKSKHQSSVLTTVKELILGVDKSDAVAVQLRQISLTCWNDLNDIETSLVFLRMASKLVIDEDIKYKFSQDMSSLIGIKKRNLCWFCKSNDASNSHSHTSLEVWKYAETGFLASLISSGRKYYHKEVPIPRCKDCQTAHNNIGFLNFGLKRDLNLKKEGYINSIPDLSEWNIGSSPN